MCKYSTLKSLFSRSLLRSSTLHQAILLSLLLCNVFYLSPSQANSAGSSLAHQERKQYGPVVKFESAWSIAETLKPVKGVSIYQRVVAIFIFNPEAFRDNDINQIIEGSYLSLPTIEEIQTISSKEAQAVLSGQVVNIDSVELPRKNVLSPKAKQAEVIKPEIKKALVTSNNEKTDINHQQRSRQEQENKAFAQAPAQKKSLQDEVKAAQANSQNLDKETHEKQQLQSSSSKAAKKIVQDLLKQDTKDPLKTHDGIENQDQNDSESSWGMFVIYLFLGFMLAYHLLRKIQRKRAGAKMRAQLVLSPEVHGQEKTKLKPAALTMSNTASVTKLKPKLHLANNTSETALASALPVKETNDTIIKKTEQKHAQQQPIKLSNTREEKTNTTTKVKTKSDQKLQAEEGDHNATKLELAEAYLNIGNKDGAKALLSEVLNEGCERQIKLANELLIKANVA